MKMTNNGDDDNCDSSNFTEEQCALFKQRFSKRYDLNVDPGRYIILKPYFVEQLPVGELSVVEQLPVEEVLSMVEQLLMEELLSVVEQSLAEVLLSVVELSLAEMLLSMVEQSPVEELLSIVKQLVVVCSVSDGTLIFIMVSHCLTIEYFQMISPRSS